VGIKKKAIVSVTNDLYTDNRVDKVCTFLVHQGYEVTLVGRLRKTSKPLPDRIYKTKRMKLGFDKGALFYAAFNFRLFWFLAFRKADLLVANDLDTLLGNYAASKLKPKCRLVYDSHEYFTEVPELEGRKRVKRTWEGIESWIFPKLKTVYTVNESIAQLYEEKYKKKLFVVRNVSPKWKPQNLQSKQELGIPEDKTVIILQGAGINIHRGAEEAVEAMKHVENAVLIFVGDGDVIPSLKETVSNENLKEKVLFFGKRPYQEMMQFTYHADLGLTLDKANNINYKLSLPNKVFDYIHAGTPIICTNLVEVSRIVLKHDVGVVIEEISATHLAEKINELVKNKERLNQMKANCEKAALVENWEKECEILEEIYPKVDQ
jgi:glycosyltransferase involved in cell wall biosynthesis